MHCTHCGHQNTYGAGFCIHCGAQLQPPPAQSDASGIVKRVADNHQLSAILWIVLGALQILGCITIVAGIWNLIIGIRQLGSVKAIVPNNPNVYRDFDASFGMIIASGIINLVLGGVIGVSISVLDYYNRDMVLRNKHVFIGQ